MQIKFQAVDGYGKLQVVDPSDGAVTHDIEVSAGQQIVVTATTADSPADLTVGEVEKTPEPEAEAAETGEGEQAGEVEQPGAEAEGAEDPAGAGGESPQDEAGERGTPAEDGDGDGAAA